jgi:hypothetical protein
MVVKELPAGMNEAKLLEHELWDDHSRTVALERSHELSSGTLPHLKSLLSLMREALLIHGGAFD